jgi:hypothetical protein
LGIYQYNRDRLADTEFVPGTIALLVEGNYCRLLDGRRTPGMVERYFDDSAMFRWRIMDFEDKGKYWDVPAEGVTRYQFRKDAKRLDANRIKRIEASIQKYQRRLTIEPVEEEKHQTESEIEAVEHVITHWLRSNSVFFKDQEQLDVKSGIAPRSLAGDLIRYVRSIGMEEIERRTADSMVLNPNSGEWIKGMAIVLAEMSLVPYRANIPRTRDIFEGLGRKENRRNYFIHRLAFVRAYFHLLGMKEVTLYRGMCTEWEWGTRPSSRTFVSFTFSIKVAGSHCDFKGNSDKKHSYLLKRTFAVEDLFMTSLETDAMNRQYKEAEALVLYREEDRTFW